MCHLPLVFLLACQKAPPSGWPPDSRPPDTDTSEPANTDSSPAPHTGTPTAGWPDAPVAPYTIIRGRLTSETGLEADEFIGRHIRVVGDLWGDGHDNLTTNGIWQALVFRGLPGPGEVTTEEVAARISGPLSIAWPAGDVDADGFDDVWVKWRVFRGPLAPEVAYDTDWHAEIGDGVEGSRIERAFDADGDGHEDAAVYDDDHLAVVHYGPFLAGTTRLGWYADNVDKSQISRFKSDCGTGNDDDNGWVWPDLFGPGRHGLASVNLESATYDCIHTVELFDISGPRGRDLSSADAIAWHTAAEVWPAGDHDGDGVQDLVFGQTHFGPFAGHLPYPDDQDPKQVWTPLSEVVRSVGDMNGDGRRELLVSVSKEGYASTWWIVPSTHLGVDLPVAEIGVPLDSPNWITAKNTVTGDLDGDGKAELVLAGGGDAVGGRISIWRGADLFPN